jgi:hypothetical protein
MLFYSILSPFSMSMELYSSPRAKFLWDHSCRIFSNTFGRVFNPADWDYGPFLLVFFVIAAGLNALVTSAFFLLRSSPTAH